MKGKIKKFWKKNKKEIIIVGGCVLVAGVAIMILKGKMISELKDGFTFKGMTDLEILKYIKEQTTNGDFILPARLNEKTLEVTRDAFINAISEDVSAQVCVVMERDIAIQVMEAVIAAKEA